MTRTNKYTEKRRKSIVTPYGQWIYPGKVTTIPGNNITMRGVPYPVLGVSDKGDTKMMLPRMDYLFKGNEVTEYPVMQQGGFGRKRVEKNGMEYLKDTDGYTGVVQKQTQHGLGVSRRYDAPVYQYYDNGNPVGESWKGAGDFQNDVVKDYESEPVAQFSRKYSNYDPNSLTFFKDLATGETPFKPYEMPLDRSLLNPSIGNGISQSVIANSFPTYIPPTANHVSAVSATTNNVPDNSHRNRFDQWNDYREKYWYGKMSGEADMNKNSYTSEYRRNSNGNAEDFTTIGFGNTGIPYGTTWDYNTAIEKSFDSWDDHIQLAKRYYNNMKKEHQDWPEWDMLPQFTRDLFGHYNYGVRNGIMGFPKFVGAMATGDYDTALKEYTIKNNKKRNDYVGGWLNFMLGNADVYPDPMNKSNMREGYNYQNGGRIHIKEANRGKFTEAAQRAGKSIQAYAAQILANKGNYSPTLIKRANFARNSASWKHQEGGDAIKKYLEGNYIQPMSVDSVMGAWNDQLAKGFAKGDMIANHVGNALNAAATASAAVATQFGKNYTKDIMAGQGNEQTSVAAPLYLPSEQNNNIQPLNNGYYGFPVIDNGAQPAKKYHSFRILDPDYIKNPEEYYEYIESIIPADIIGPKPPISKEPSLPGFKLATGGLFSTPAEIERGEIVSTPTGDSIANGIMDYHELFSNRNEKEKNIVNLTNNLHKDVQRNPQLSPITDRVNKYTSMRRNGKTFIFPSTVGRNGEILEPKNGNIYWLAKTINKK